MDSKVCCWSLLVIIGLLLPIQVEPIVNGVVVAQGEFPHHALLGYPTESGGDYEFYCGGSLINRRYVLTAAHCVHRKIPDIVRLGEHNLQDDSDKQVDYEIDTIIRHPDYTARFTYNDIALLKLKQDVTTSKSIQPACLWNSASRNFTSVTATGFGVTGYLENQLSNKLQKVELDVLETNECDTKYGSSRKFPRGILSSQLCIGSRSGGKDTCQGDAGGPVQVTTGSDSCPYYIVGITSVGISCGIDGSSESIYTNVASYSDWIKKTSQE